MSRANLTEGPIGPTLYRMSLPMVMGIVAILVFNFVDAYYVSLLGTEYLAAISFTFPATFALMSLNLGLGTANSTLVAIELGAGREREARQMATYSIVIAVVLVFCAAGVGIAVIDPMFRLLGADSTGLVLIHDYLDIWYLGVGVLTVPMLCNSAMRASGDTRTPSIIMAMSALINGILDPFLIFGIGPFPRMEMQGAALSSVLSWWIAGAVALITIHRKQILDLSRPSYAVVTDCWRRLIKIALPIVGSNMLNPLALGVVTALVAQFGVAAVAATGVGMRLEPILIIAVMGLATCIPPFVGQNLGAGRLERINQAMRLSLRFALVWQGGLALVLYLAAPWIAGLFGQAEQAIEIIRLFLSILPLSYGFLAWVLLGGAQFNGLRMPNKGLLLNGGRLFVLYIPFAYWGSQWNGIEGLYMGCALANVLAGCVAWGWIRHTNKQLLLRMDASMSGV
ncbi:MAG: MATE family efflux transporter [Gammaproteobacteria bacterium]|nr:MAG: MATE family efflux transporter [Gammaproteobacteria bacterium]